MIFLTFFEHRKLCCLEGIKRILVDLEKRLEYFAIVSHQFFGLDEEVVID